MANRLQMCRQVLGPRYSINSTLQLSNPPPIYCCMVLCRLKNLHTRERGSWSLEKNQDRASEREREGTGDGDCKRGDRKWPLMKYLRNQPSLTKGWREREGKCRDG
ncbi:hypothetical protein AALO_G00261650 [Alosa alosa]|uniref:Uncharacterized protein n=1 Tax=Alosa alosa TaxID=278164 RepID=A0AAV6FXM8_9TELE|nr:hypothetical protein AALO_G00261650 [Alosa alosa]